MDLRTPRMSFFAFFNCTGSDAKHLAAKAPVEKEMEIGLFTKPSFLLLVMKNCGVRRDEEERAHFTNTGDREGCDPESMEEEKDATGDEKASVWTIFVCPVGRWERNKGEWR